MREHCGHQRVRRCSEDAVPTEMTESRGPMSGPRGEIALRSSPPIFLLSNSLKGMKMGREALCGRLRSRFSEATEAMRFQESLCLGYRPSSEDQHVESIKTRSRDGADSGLVGVPRIERRMGEVTRRESGARGPTPSRENHQDPHESTSGTRRPRKKRPKPRGEEAPRPRVRRESESRRDCAHERWT